MHLKTHKLPPHRPKPTNLVGSNHFTWTCQEKQRQPYPKKTLVSPEIHATRGQMERLSSNLEIMTWYRLQELDRASTES